MDGEQVTLRTNVEGTIVAYQEDNGRWQSGAYNVHTQTWVLSPWTVKAPSYDLEFVGTVWEYPSQHRFAVCFEKGVFIEHSPERGITWVGYPTGEADEIDGTALERTLQVSDLSTAAFVAGRVLALYHQLEAI